MKLNVKSNEINVKLYEEKKGGRGGGGSPDPRVLDQTSYLFRQGQKHGGLARISLQLETRKIRTDRPLVWQN